MLRLSPSRTAISAVALSRTRLAAAGVNFPSASRLLSTATGDAKTSTPKRHHVVIVGAGFGGLTTVQSLKGAPVDITIIDRANYHLFQPLLYQVGSCQLSPSDIAWPVRHLLGNRSEVTTLMGEVMDVDVDRQTVYLDHNLPINYDTLVLATGAKDAYFGNDDWERFAPGLKSLKDATTLRRRLLMAFEMAEREPNPERRSSQMTLAIIGGGPTGVELAGAMAQMAHRTLPNEFRNIDTRKTRIVLIEAGPRVLSAFTEDLSEYAKAALEDLGVEVHLNMPVSKLSKQGVEYGGQFLPCSTIFWAAGVQASPAARWLSASSDRAGRVRVEPDLSIPGHPNVFAIGDTAAVMGPNGKPIPGVAPAAKQQGAYVGKLIRNRLLGKATRKAFQYYHTGNLATIGKNKAVVDFGFIKMTGWMAWWLWGIAHIYFLIGVRSRLSVALSWLWSYTRNMRGSRLITQDHKQAP